MLIENTVDYWKFHSSGNSCLIIDVSRESAIVKGGKKVEWDNVFGPHAVATLLSRGSASDADNLLVLTSVSPVSLLGFNRDGSKVGMCCNGARCAGAFLRSQYFREATQLNASLDGLSIRLRFDENMISVELPRPEFAQQRIPVSGGQFVERQLSLIELPSVQRSFRGIFSQIGNPHFSIPCSTPQALEVAVDTLSQLSHHSAFPAGMNIELFTEREDGSLEARFFERGVGETLSSGTGSAAAAIAFCELNQRQGQVKVHSRGGSLSVRYQRDSGDLEVSGEAVLLSTGSVELYRSEDRHILPAERVG